MSYTPQLCQWVDCCKDGTENINIGIHKAFPYSETNPDLIMKILEAEMYFCKEHAKHVKWCLNDEYVKKRRIHICELPFTITKWND